MGKETEVDIYQLLKPVPIDRKKIQTADALHSLLLNHHIPADTWPEHEIPQLLDEWRRRDCELVTIGKELFRKTNPIYATVIKEIDDKVWYLHEEKRLEIDEKGNPTGKVKRTRNTLPGSLAEKGKVGENPTDTLMRGLSEELHIHINKTQLRLLDMDMFFVPLPDAFKGLTTRRQSSYYECHLTDSQYKPNGTIVFPPGSAERYAYLDKDLDSRTMTLWRWSTRPVSPPHTK